MLLYIMMTDFIEISYVNVPSVANSTKLNQLLEKEKIGRQKHSASHY